MTRIARMTADERRDYVHTFERARALISPPATGTRAPISRATLATTA